MTFRANSFVFSARLDAVAFYFPLLFALVLSMVFKGMSFEDTLVFGLIAIWLSDAGHVYASIIPVIRDPNTRQRFGPRIWIAPLVIVGSWLLLWWYFDKVFYAAFGYFAIFHVLMQQYGWLKRLQKKRVQEPWRKAFDVLVFWMIYLVPLIYWHTPMNARTRSYIFENNLSLEIPAAVWPPLHGVFWLALGIFVAVNIYESLREKSIDAGKVGFFIYSLIWFYAGLVLFPTSGFFGNVLLLTHGFAYHIHINSYRKDKDDKLSRKNFFQRKYLRYVVYAIAIVVVSRGWYSFKHYFDGHWGLPFYWIPLMVHHTWDSLLWRRSALEIASLS